MQLPLQDFTALVRTQAAAVKGAARGLIDLSVGSVLRAVLEANASVGLWIQWLIVEVLATTRAATSTGLDLDSWVADFGLARLPGIAASGSATFSRATTGLSSVVPVGALVKTGTGTDALSFAVVADAGHPAWTGAGYLLLADQLALAAPVRAVMAAMPRTNSSSSPSRPRDEGTRCVQPWWPISHPASQTAAALAG